MNYEVKYKDSNGEVVTKIVKNVTGTRDTNGHMQLLRGEVIIFQKIHHDIIEFSVIENEE